MYPVGFFSKNSVCEIQNRNFLFENVTKIKKLFNEKMTRSAGCYYELV